MQNRSQLSTLHRVNFFDMFCAFLCSPIIVCFAEKEKVEVPSDACRAKGQSEKKGSPIRRLVSICYTSP